MEAIAAMANAMNRFAAVLALTTLAACAAPPENPQMRQARIDAAQVYQTLQVQEVERQMLYSDHLLTFGYAVVACGLRTPQWMAVVRDVYARDYAVELQQIPLDAQQQVAALKYADTQVGNPAPPPYICGRLRGDETLAALDDRVGLQALQVTAAR